MDEARDAKDVAIQQEQRVNRDGERQSPKKGPQRCRVSHGVQFSGMKVGKDPISIYTDLNWLKLTARS
jgi:hypothetical protein